MNISNNIKLEQPILSILIPTKNRQHTAIACVIEAAKVGPASEAQIVVQDCSDEDSLRSLLLQHNLLERVVYQYGDPVSMTENWNRGMSYANGEYVIIVGDDDAVLPSVVNIAYWARKHGFLAVKSKQYSYYEWPDIPIELLAGKLVLKPFTGKYEVVNTVPLLKRFSKTGDDYHKIFPMVYHNLVKRSVLEEIRNKSGQYFDSLTPDVYSAYAVALTVENFTIIDYPMTMIGSSAKSNSMRLKSGQIQKHFNEFDSFQFTPIAPSSWGIYAQMADSMICAFINNDRKDMLNNVDIPRIFGRTIVFEPSRVNDHVKKFVSAMRYLEKNVPLALFQLIGNISGKIMLNLLRCFHKHSNNSYAHEQEYYNVDSIADAVAIQVSWLIENCPFEVDGNQGFEE